MNKKFVVNQRLTSDGMLCDEILKELKWESIKYKLKELYNDAELKCVAKMQYDSDEYWAVAGVTDDEKKRIQALKAIIEIDDSHICHLGDNSQIKDKVKVYNYLENRKCWEEISYSGYLYAINKLKVEENKRLFSCCERKLIAIIQDYSEYFRIYVALPPCGYCEMAFMYINEQFNNSSFEVLYTDALVPTTAPGYAHLKELGLLH